jgi:hypothetical protein
VRTFIQSGNVVFESAPKNVRTVVRKVGGVGLGDADEVVETPSR